MVDNYMLWLLGLCSATMIGMGRIIWRQTHQLQATEIKRLILEMRELTKTIKSLVAEFGDHNIKLVQHEGQLDQIKEWQTLCRPKLEQCYSHVQKADGFIINDRTLRGD